MWPVHVFFIQTRFLDYRLLVLLTVMAATLFSPYSSFALAPEEVVVVANSRANDSVKLAAYYMKQRNIPRENLIKIRTTWKEVCDRKEYEDTIAKPVRKAVKKLKKTKNIRCIVTVYGMPLKIRPPVLDRENKDEVNKIKHQLKVEQEKLKTALKDEQSRLKNIIKSLKLQVKLLQRTDARAAVDSELALVLTQKYPLENWLPNPYFLGFRHQNTLLKRDTVLMVARLDGPNPETVRRIITDAIATEKKGLVGSAYFDARWKEPQKEKKKLSGYALYDASIHKAAKHLTDTKPFPVILDDTHSLFQAGTAPDAALYCGWYSLAKYIDAFSWLPGSIGYHIASSECATLKGKDSQVWCKRMLEEGVAATIGPVYEPYVQAFPLPEIFFSKLTEGYLSLGEVYLISLPYLSWQMVLIGDPMYQPFKPQPDA